MKTYCTDQWMLVNYPTGAGGKFFISILFLFDQIAHWDPRIEHGELPYNKWFNDSWSKDIKFWVKKEPNAIWNSFYSHQWARNENLTEEEFDALAATESHPYFHECWNQGKIIVDHWHKSFQPRYFAKAKWIEILIDKNDIELYQQSVMKKVYLWNDNNKTALATLQHPDWAPNNKIKNLVLQYKNPYIISGYASEQDFFDNYVLDVPTIKSFVNASSNPSALLSLKFGDLISKSRFFSVIERLEDYFGQKLNRNDVNGYHDIWLHRSNFIT